MPSVIGTHIKSPSQHLLTGRLRVCQSLHVDSGRIKTLTGMILSRTCCQTYCNAQGPSLGKYWGSESSMLKSCIIFCAQVFFIRDGFKFPDLVHALRPNPANNIQEAWRFLDFLSYHPESAHMVSHRTNASSALDAPHL